MKTLCSSHGTPTSRPGRKRQPPFYPTLLPNSNYSARQIPGKKLREPKILIPFTSFEQTIMLFLANLRLCLPMFLVCMARAGIWDSSSEEPCIQDIMRSTSLSGIVIRGICLLLLFFCLALQDGGTMIAVQ